MNNDEYSLENHISSMEDELKYISQKAKDLKSFIDNKELFNERIKDERLKDFTGAQLMAMNVYKGLLEKRIKMFKDMNNE